MFTIYHNPKCAKSRAGVEFLKSKGVEYKKDPLTRDHLKELLMKLGKSAKDIIRTQEDVFKENFRGKNFTDEEWITILLENPKLIQRPIVVKGYKAVLAQPVDEIEKLLR
jgi:arsenate reductase